MEISAKEKGGKNEDFKGREEERGTIKFPAGGGGGGAPTVKSSEGPFKYDV